MDNESKETNTQNNVDNGLSSSILDGQASGGGSQPTNDATVTNPMVSESPAPKSPAKKIIMVLTILLVVAMVALTIYAFLGGSDNTSNTNTPTKSAAPAKATTTDVDETTEEVDKSLNSVDDSEDFDSNAASDSSLEL